MLKLPVLQRKLSASSLIYSNKKDKNFILIKCGVFAAASGVE